MSRSLIPVAAAVVLLNFSGACGDARIADLTRDILAPMECPSDVGTGPMMNGRYADTTKYQYVTLFIDGRVAAWNINATKREPLATLHAPPFADIKNVTIASHTLSYDEIARRYKTCPGVDVELVTTKRGDWRPSSAMFGF
jgi:hypothetical protein